MAIKSDFIHFGDSDREYTYFPSSLLSLNRALGDMRGMRGGRLVQLVSEPSTGKTTLALDICAQAQRLGLLKEIEVQDGKNTRIVTAVYVDTERTFDKAYATKIGVDTSKLLIVKPVKATQGMMLVEQLVKAGIQLVIYDSIPATVPDDELDKAMDDNAKVAGSASLIDRWIKRMISMLDDSDSLLIAINQWRANMSTMSRKEKKYFGPRSLHYFSSIILELSRIKNTEGVSRVEAMATKNKQAKEGTKTEFNLVHGSGIDVLQDTLDLAIEYGIITKTGAWYYYGEEKAQGAEQAKTRFDMKDIHAKVSATIHV